MSGILYAIDKWARLYPKAPAVTGMDVSLDYKQLHQAVCEIQDYLEQLRPNVVGVFMDNSPAWVVIDLAAQAAKIPLLPIPGFFSEQQIKHAIDDAGCDCVFTDQPERLAYLKQRGQQIHESLSMMSNENARIWNVSLEQAGDYLLNKDIAKVTYTSGTTGSPKGVCLKQSAIDSVVLSLGKAVEMEATDRHLCALPLATLLENIAGVYVPLLASGQVFVYPMDMVGLHGATEFDAYQFYKLLVKVRATTTVLVPHLLQSLVEVYEQKKEQISSLRFVAVGGAPISADLLERAEQNQIPVFEGYGLSESCSVVTVNTHQHHRPGSVGKPLHHIDLKIANDGEILVRGACYSGYLGGHNEDIEYLNTGDIGYLDKDGYLFLSGRKKNMFITAYGRNVSPEWVERELVLHADIEQVVIFGEGRPWNVAIIVPALNSSELDVDSAISEVNKLLPDYARIKTWIPAIESFQVRNNYLTATGRLRRQEIWNQYAEHIEKLYTTDHDSYRKTA